MSYNDYDAAPILMYKKFFLTVSLLSVGAFLFYFFIFSSNEKPNADLALKAFLSKNYEEAESLLLQRDYLYRGYIKQATHHYEEAKRLFELEGEKVEEAHFAALLNQVLLDQFEGLKNGIPSKHQLFFDGLFHYTEGNFEKASTMLCKYLNERHNYTKNLWFDHVIENQFPNTLIEYHVMHALLESGQSESIRTRLKDVEEDATIFYLLGFSHLNANPKLALFYFEKMNPEECSLIGKKKLSAPIKNTAEKLLKKKDPLFFSFVKLLEKWKEHTALEPIATLFAKELIQGTEFSVDTEAVPHFTTLVGNKINSNFETLLKNCDQKELFPLFQKLEKGAFATPKMKEAFNAFIEDKIITSIAKEDENLERTSSFLELWKKINGVKKAEALANRLQQLGKIYWLKENEERKGTKLLVLGMDLKTKKEKIAAIKEIEGFFQALYARAEGANLVKRLSLIYDALQELKIEPKALYPKGAIANYLADAEYLFNSRNYFSAKTHAELVLKLEPENDKARLLFALTCYHTGDYKQALTVLQTVEKRDEYAEKVLLLCQTTSHHAKEKELVQLDVLDTLDENE